MNTATSSAAPGTATTPASSNRAALVSRVLTPIFFVLIALVQIVVGVDSLPLWMQTMSARAGVDTMLLLRVVIGLELAAVVLMLLMAPLAARVAMAALAAMCFVMVAELAAVKAAPGLAWRVILLLIPAGLLLMLSMRKSQAERTASSGPALLALLGVGAAAAVAWAVPLVPGSLPIGEQAEPAMLIELMRDIPREQLPVKEYLNEPNVWVGAHITALPWAPYVPQQMMDELATGTHLVMFYHPEVEQSKLVFEEHVASVAPMPCWAVRVPRNSAADSRPQYPPTRLPSPNCRLVCLPPGPFWFVYIPTMLRIDNGIVTCFSTGDDDLHYEQCLAGHQSAGPPGG